MKKLFILLILFVSCNSKPIKEFILDNDEKLILFKNQTFEMETRLLERKYIQKGTWEGSLEEGQTFKLTSETKTKNSFVHVYRIVGENAVLQ